MKEDSLKGMLLYRFGRNESALLLLAVTIAAAGFYAKLSSDLTSIQMEEENYAHYSVTTV